MLRDASSVGLGAALGALARFALEGPLSLLGVNLVGCLLMGWLRPGAFWGRGVLGGFTSFSTFAHLTATTTPLAAAGYVVATLAGCVAAWFLGDLLADSRGRAA